MKKAKFKKVFEEGKYYYSKYLMAYIVKNHENCNDLGIIVSKKIGNSVVRHRYTRLIREVYRLNIDKYLNNYSLILISKKSIVDCNYHLLEKDFFKLMEYIKKNEKSIN